MPLVLVHSAFAGQYPPEPHLISSRDEIENGKEDIAEFRDAWVAKHPFPGVRSTWQEKCDWLKALQKENDDELENLSFTNPPDACEIASDMLLEEAPDTIVVQLYVRRDQLDRIQLPDQASKSRFAEGIVEYGRKGFLSTKGERTWEAYKAWLVENHSENDDGDKVLLGSVECHKGKLLDDVFCSFVRKLGIFMCADTVEELHSSVDSCNNWGLMDQVGSNLYSPLSDKDEDKNDTVCFPLLLRINDLTPERMAEKEFLSRLEDITEETKKQAGHHGKYYHLVKKKTAVPVMDSNGNERVPISPDNYYVLWLPREYKQVMETIRSHFDWGKGESRDIQLRLQKGNTDTGNLKMDIFSAEFEALKEERCWATKFARAFALTRIAAYDTYWMHDNEFPEEIAQKVTKLGDYWRNSLLKKDDETLGIGLGDLEKENVDSSEESESRKALICLLERLGKQFIEASEYCKVKFTVVGRSRKKKASSAQNKKRKVESG